GPSQTAFFLSTNVTFETTDTPLGARDVPGLAPSAISTASTNLQIPPNTATGLYYVIARADNNNAVVETSEAHNVAVASVQVGPDLTIPALSMPTTAVAGSTITANDTTKNLGAGDAGASTTQFRFSTNTALDASDQLIGSRSV